ncbi:MAG: hypothetical protein AVDCRST_MAG32-2834 [uncultured Nocardioides sp.]|uniref:Uncharacterized protein n=1 Tax=uncultured Nocardioides sp. TaxID=198441 RepID=A0A6J4NWG9_9ACTN|nr:MAG: hypothetical protein AVDCRST_MAG32-2834 [uncultured Nocardioides sp.]
MCHAAGALVSSTVGKEDPRRGCFPGHARPIVRVGSARLGSREDTRGHAVRRGAPASSPYGSSESPHMRGLRHMVGVATPTRCRTRPPSGPTPVRRPTSPRGSTAWPLA